MALVSARLNSGETIGFLEADNIILIIFLVSQLSMYLKLLADYYNVNDKKILKKVLHATRNQMLVYRMRLQHRQHQLQ